MLVAAAVVPHPPLLVPGLAAGASAELDHVRAAATAAVRRVVAAAVDLLVLVGGAPPTSPSGEHAAGEWGSLAGYGGRSLLPEGDGPPTLPLSLTLARWLLDRSVSPAAAPPTALVSVPAAAPVADCVALGAELAARAPRVGLLVAGDGSARRSLKGPGYLDPRAEPYDAAVATAFAAGDAAALLSLDPALAGELLVAGRAAWQVLGGAAGDAALTGELTADETPYGVCYLVATWLAVGSPAERP